VLNNDDFDADDVVEINFGGDMATEVVKRAAERVNPIRIKEVFASRGKAMRAEPISLLYGKDRALHHRGLDKLEDCRTAWGKGIAGGTAPCHIAARP
jgi:phage terminase large subunit-like protein